MVPEDTDPEVLAAIGPLNLDRTIGRDPELMQRIRALGHHLIQPGLIPARQRELLILRVGWRCGSEYEFGHHSRLGLEAGLSSQELRSLASTETDIWGADDLALIDLVDEACDINTVSDSTWLRLQRCWSDEQVIHMLCLIGLYRLVSTFLNGARVEREPGVPGWPGIE